MAYIIHRSEKQGHLSKKANWLAPNRKFRKWFFRSAVLNIIQLIVTLFIIFNK